MTLTVHIIISKVATKRTKIKFVTSKLVERKKMKWGGKKSVQKKAREKEKLKYQIASRHKYKTQNKLEINPNI